MAVSFPANPSTNDVYQYNGIKYVYDGVKWVASGKSFFDLNTGLLSDGTVTANAMTVTNDLEVGTGVLDVDTTNEIVKIGGNPAINTSTYKLSVLDQSGDAKALIRSEVNGVAGDAVLDLFGVDDQQHFMKSGSIRGEGGTAALIIESDPDDDFWATDPVIIFKQIGAETMRLQYNEGGISFNGDTAAANALDDYEEGTWTPTFYGADTAGSYTFTIVSARYTKIGNCVTVQGEIDNITTVSAGSGAIRIGGLPFPVGGARACGGCALVQFNVDDTTVNIVARTDTIGTDYVTFAQTRDNAGGTSVQVTEKNNDNADIDFSVTYFTGT